jgi:plasmid stabilization system protein ParE
VAKNARPVLTSVHLTDRALRDIAVIEALSIAKFGKRVANQYLTKLEAGIGRVSDNPDLLRGEATFHESLKFYRIERHLLVCETGMTGKIFILTLLHASLDVPSRLTELEPQLSTEIEMFLERFIRS